MYYIPPGQAPVKIEDRLIRPNGVQLSRDETKLYVSDSNGDHVIAWDIRPNGLVENRREFATLKGRSSRDNGLGGIKTFADGMAVDNDNRLYISLNEEESKEIEKLVRIGRKDATISFL